MSITKAKVREAIAALEKSGVFYDTANEGIHIMISLNGNRVDFWPTSGKWIRRGFKDEHGRGLSSLLDMIRGGQ